MTLESEAGEVTDPTGSATALIQLSDLDDRLEVAAKESRRRGVWATLATLGAPVNFLAQALIFWSDGWPPAGGAGFGAMCLFAGATWFWWSRAAGERKRLQQERRNLSSTLHSISALQSDQEDAG